MKTMYTLRQLAETLERQRDEKVDYLVPPDKIHFVSTHIRSEIDLLGTGATDLRLNDVAHGQFADKLKIPKRYYQRLRAEMPDLLDQNVNRLLRHHPNGEPSRWMIRTLGPVARAALSDQYARIDNYDIADAVLPILGDIPDVRFPSTAITDTRLYIKATTPRLTGEVKVGEVVQGGVYIANSEVGYGKFVIAPFVTTLACTNGMTVMRRGDGMMERIHLGRRVDADDHGRVFSDETRVAQDRVFMMEVRDVVRAAVDEVRFRELVEDMARAARSEPLTDVSAAVEVLAQRESLTDGESRGVLTHLAAGGDLSRWGLLSAVTRTAEDAESYDRASELEALGGKILGYSGRAWRELVEAEA